MPSTRSSHVKPKTSRPPTISISPAKSPTTDPAPSNHDENIAKESKFLPSSQSPKTLQKIGQNNSRENPFNYPDKASFVGGADDEAAESVSDFTDYPAGSTTGIKSPYFGSRSGYQTPPTTETFSAEFGGNGESRKGSESTDGSIIFSKIYGRKSSEVSRQGDWNQGIPIQDSPTLGSDFTASMRALKSPTTDSHGRQLSVSTGDGKSSRSLGSPNFPRSLNSPNPTVNSMATTSTSARAEEGLKVPFLPRILRVLGGTGASPKCDESEAVNEANHKSVFEDDSSDDDDEDIEGVMEIQELEQVPRGRPLLVHQGSSTIVCLKEMLRSGPVPSVIHPPPSLDSRSTPGPPTTKAARLLGHEVAICTGLSSSAPHTSPPPRLRSNPGPSTAKAAQILGPEVQVQDVLAGSREYPAPIARIAAAPIEVEKYGNRKGSPSSEKKSTVAWANDDGLGSWRAPVLNLADGLRSNPVPATAKVRRAATVPSWRKQEAAVPQARAPPLASPTIIIPPPPSHSQLDKAAITDQDHYIQVVEQRLHTTMEELGRLKIELGSLKERIDGPKVPRQSRSSRFLNSVFRRSTAPSGRK